MRKVNRACSFVLLAAILLGSLCSCGLFSKFTNKDPSSSGPLDGGRIDDLDMVSTKTAPAPVTPVYNGKNTLTCAITGALEEPSPFFFKTENGRLAADLSFVKLLSLDRSGSLVTEGVKGQTVSYLGEDHTYYGIADLKVTKNADGTADYDFTLRDDVFFSDGTNLTADDVIFSMYVLLDPSYEGYCALSGLPISGLDAYRAGMSCLGDIIYDSIEEGVSSLAYSEADKQRFTERIEAAKQKYVSDFLGYMAEDTEAEVLSQNAGKWAELAASEKYLTAITMVMYGYAVWEKTDGGDYTGTLITANGNRYDCISEFPAHADLFSCIAAESSSLLDIDAKHPEASLKDSLKAAFGSSFEYFFEVRHESGESAASVSGISKTGMYSFRVKLDRYDVSDAYAFSLYVAPLHSYGSREDYKYTEQRFGFSKGDLRRVRNVSSKVCSGAYFYKGEVDGVYRFERNKLYYLGCPYVSYVDLASTLEGEDIALAISEGKYDIASRELDSALLSRIKELNKTQEALTVEKYANAKYTYIGLNCDEVKVGQEPSSSKSLSLRTAFCVLFSYYADSAYEGDITEVSYGVSGPVQPSWSVEGADSVYGKDLFGEDIRLPSMTDRETQDRLRTALLGYFVAAGYILDKTETKIEPSPESGAPQFTFVTVKDGVYADHVENTVKNAQRMLADIGVSLNLEYAEDEKAMQAMLTAGGVDMWAYVRALTPEPEIASFYYSKNSPKHNDGTGENYSRVSDKTLDAALAEISYTYEKEERLGKLRDALERVYANGAEVPLYVGCDALLFGAQTFSDDAEPSGVSLYYTWTDTVHKLKMS